MEPITKSKKYVDRDSRKTGKLGKRTVVHPEFAGIKGRFEISYKNINKIDINRRGLGERLWEWVWGMSDEKKRAFERVKSDLEARQLDKLDKLKPIIDKLDKKEYLDSEETKELKKVILIKSQEEMGIEDAAGKTEAFYLFDKLIESNTEKAFLEFVTQINKLGIGQKLNMKSALDFVVRKVRNQQGFNAQEIELVRDTIMNGLVEKKKENVNAALIQGMQAQHKQDEERIKALEEQLAKAQAEVKKKDTALKKDEKALVELAQKNDELGENKVNRERDYDELGKFNDELYAVNQDLEQEFTQLDKKLLEQTDKIKKLEQEVSNTKRENQNLIQEKNRLNIMENEYKLLKEKTKNYDSIQNELFTLQGIIGSVAGKKEELAILDKKLTEAENAIGDNLRKNQELENAITTRAQELKEIEVRQLELSEKLKKEIMPILILGQMMGAAMPEEMKGEYALNLGETEEINKLLNKEEFTLEEVNKLKTWVSTLMKELEYENQLRRTVPKAIENLQTEFVRLKPAEPADVENYLKKLKTRLLQGNNPYPELVTSDKNPRIFVFFVDGELLKIEVNSADDIIDLEEELKACRERAEAYKRFEEVERAGA